MLQLGLAGDAGAMLAMLAGVYLVMAPGLVPVYLIQRQGRLQVLARIGMAQVLADNLLTIILVLSGMGAWGVVLPKLLVAPIWLLAVRRTQPWRRNPAAGFVPDAELLRFAAPVLGSEILAAARFNLDNLMVGAVLGVEALGLYFFVFNAGVGFSLSLTNALANVLFPHFAAAREQAGALREALDRAFRRIVPAIAALIALQAAAALFYVPIVFGARWEGAAGLVALLCASAITRPFAEAAAQAMRAAGLGGRELRWAMFGTTAYLGCFALALPFGLPTAIAVLTVTATLLQLGLAIAARRALA
jgi:PST family polysaccharide transporter